LLACSSRTKLRLEAVTKPNCSETGSEAEGASNQKKLKKDLEREAHNTAKQMAAIEKELEAVRQGVQQEEAAEGAGSSPPRWLVIGSAWDAGKGKWGRLAGHWSKPGDAWSRKLVVAEKELCDVLERLEGAKSEALAQARGLDPAHLAKQRGEEKKGLQASLHRLTERGSTVFKGPKGAQP